MRFVYKRSIQCKVKENYCYLWTARQNTLSNKAFEINRLLCSSPTISIHMHTSTLSTLLRHTKKYTKIHHCQMDFCMRHVNRLISIYQVRCTALHLILLTIIPRSTTWTRNLCQFHCKKPIRQYSLSVFIVLISPSCDPILNLVFWSDSTH